MKSPSSALIDARPPRVHLAPDYVSSAAVETIELCASVGLVLDDWQALILTDQLGERPDGRWAAFECGCVVPRQNGKGGIIEARKLGGLFLFGEKLIVYSAHQFKTAQEHFLRIKELVTNSDDLRPRVKQVRDSHGSEGIEVYGEQPHRLTRTRRLLYVARSGKSGRGFTGDVNILDEAQDLKATHIAAMMPTMSAKSVHGNPQLLYFGTPPDTDENPDPTWPSVRKRGLAGASRLCWHEYSPGEEGTYDPGDREVWRATNPALGIRISEEFVETEFAAMMPTMPAKFRRERLGAWDRDPAEGWLVIPRREFEAAFDPGSQALDPLSMCFDANPTRTTSWIAAAGARADGLLHAEVIARLPGIAGLVDRVAELHERWHPSWTADASGPAGSVIDEVEQRLGVEVRRLSRPDLGRACVRLFDMVAGEDPALRVLRWTGDPECAAALTDAVKGAVKRDLGDGLWAWHRMSSEVDISPLVAVTGAADGHVNAPAPPQQSFASWR